MQADVPLPDGVDQVSVTSLAAHVLINEGVGGEWPLGIHFVDDATMQRAHVAFMDIDEPTDIMTFPYGDDGEEWELDLEDGEPEQGGDLLISVERAAENAAEAGWSTARELCFLVVHGMLHLLGWDDASDPERAAMLERQAQILSNWREAPASIR